MQELLKKLCDEMYESIPHDDPAWGLFKQLAERLNCLRDAPAQPTGTGIN